MCAGVQIARRKMEINGEITDAHADGIKKFTPVFAALYDTMSES